MILWESARSSNIAKVGYDNDTQELHVQFNSGAVYAYIDVPLDLYESFKDGGFSGRYLNEYIKKSFEFRRVS